jgi:hypothetical protein
VLPKVGGFAEGRSTVANNIQLVYFLLVFVLVPMIARYMRILSAGANEGFFAVGACVLCLLIHFEFEFEFELESTGSTK